MHVGSSWFFIVRIPTEYYIILSGNFVIDWSPDPPVEKGTSAFKTFRLLSPGVSAVVQKRTKDFDADWNGDSYRPWQCCVKQQSGSPNEYFVKPRKCAL